MAQTVDPATPAPGASWAPRWTPGPWNYSQDSIDPEWWIVTLAGGLVIANVNDHAHQEANARLIAAAPDLYEVVATLVGALDANPNAPLADVMFAWRISDNGERAARAALLKATEGAGG